MADHYSHTIRTWNKLALVYEERFMDLNLYDSTYDLFCSELNNPRASILEIGCGPGNITRQLLLRMPDSVIHGIDVAPEMIELARKNNPEAIFTILDARNLPQIRQRYDGVVCGFCIPYLNKTDVDEMFENSAKLLNENGLFYVSCIEDEYENSYYQTGSTGDQVFVHYYTEIELVESLQQRSFKHLETRRISYALSDGSEQIHLIILARKV